MILKSVRECAGEKMEIIQKEEAYGVFGTSQ